MENNVTKTSDFLEDTGKPLTKENINEIYLTNDIIFSNCKLYNEYIQSLLNIIFETYMGDEFTNQEEQINHFRWCWDKNKKIFEEKGVIIHSNKLYDYFLEFMFEVYYQLTLKDENVNTHKNIARLWAYIFDYDKPKKTADIETLIEIYNIFQRSRKFS